LNIKCLSANFPDVEKLQILCGFGAIERATDVAGATPAVPPTGTAGLPPTLLRSFGGLIRKPTEASTKAGRPARRVAIVAAKADAEIRRRLIDSAAQIENGLDAPGLRAFQGDWRDGP
jgi:hypothetical protein